MPTLLIISRSFDQSWLRDAPELRGYEVENVSDDLEALRVLRERPCDVVLTDPRTTIEEDIELFQEMKRLRPRLRIIALASEATTEELIAALQAHVFACFKEPYDHNEIAAMTARALQAKNWKDGIEVLSARPDWIALRVAAQKLTAERLVLVMDEIRDDLPETEKEALITAFRETLLNAMEHGAGFNPELAVEVSAVRSQRSIVYHFRDPGPGFNPEALPHAAVSNTADNPIAHAEYREEQGLRPGGFGILLTMSLVDELIYNERGNEVLMIKYLPT